jgi:hypothetical protein
MNKNMDYTNTRWLSLVNFDQKFYKMFNAASTQQRILANW